jgi:peptide/nickel transport system permease protein
LIAWLAATLNFFLPRLTGQDPVRVKLLQQAQLGGYVQAGIEEMVREYDRRFGLDRPLWAQYLAFLRGAASLDFNYSIANYPRTVNAMIAEALPWTVALLGTTTVVSFALGTFLGALLGWPGAPRWMRWLMPPLWALHAIPFFLLGLILIYLFSFRFPVLPMFGGYSAGAFPALTVPFVLDLVRHAILPALSIVLVATGGWALSMRGMMVTTQGEDYVIFAEAKGLRSLTIFLRYCVRNALLPQATALALALGQIVSGAVLVEVIFGYPGIGTVLFQAIRENDHFLIQGIVFTVIVALGLATLMLDAIYPLLDPRISYRKA